MTSADAQRDWTLWQRLVHVAEQYPQRSALLFVDDEGRESRRSYAELVDGAARLSERLSEIGVRRGDRVALLVTSRIEWVEVCFAVARLGAVLVPVNTRLVAPEIAYVLRQSGSRYLITLDRFRGVRLLDRVKAILPELGRQEPGQTISAELPDLRVVIVCGRDGAVDAPGCFSYEELRGPLDGVQSPATRAAEQGQPDDIGMIKYTSGSTGFPKGAALDQAGIVRTVLNITDRIESGPDDAWFTGMPFFHVGGSVWSLFTALLRGSRLVFTESHEPHRALRMIERERCTIVYGVPAMIRDLLAELRVHEFDLSSVWMISATTPALVEEVHARIPSVRLGLNAFGSTETFGPFSVISPRDPWEKRHTTMGRPLPGNQLRVIDPETGREVPPGQPGEGILSGVLMRGYWNAPPGATGLDEDGAYHSGDIVTCDADGYVTWVGRYKAMLKVGGENIAAEEVENAIIEHDDVLDAIVVPVPDERLDQIARAYVVRQSGATLTAEQLLGWLGGRIAPFKIPRQVVFVPDFPRTGSGKIDRAAVANLAGAAAPDTSPV